MVDKTTVKTPRRRHFRRQRRIVIERIPAGHGVKCPRLKITLHRRTCWLRRLHSMLLALRGEHRAWNWTCSSCERGAAVAARMAGETQEHRICDSILRDV
jgi:hypothetical protein